MTRFLVSTYSAYLKGSISNSHNSHSIIRRPNWNNDIFYRWESCNGRFNTPSWPD